MNAFLARFGERGDMNQYWYSAHTIDVMVSEIEAHATRAAFLSTPSVYFSLPRDSAVRKESVVFDFDEQFGQDAKLLDPAKNFVRFDFNAVEALPAHLHHSFDYAVCDPPFITELVWEKYAQAIRALLKPDGGKMLLSTIPENAAMLADKLGCRPCAFRPSIPNLVYQYDFFTNYDLELLSQRNPEIPE